MALEFNWRCKICDVTHTQCFFTHPPLPHLSLFLVAVFIVSAWLEDGASPTINRISQRIQTIVGLSLHPEHAEPLQVSREVHLSLVLILPISPHIFVEERPRILNSSEPLEVNDTDSYPWGIGIVNSRVHLYEYLTCDSKHNEPQHF